MVLAIGICVQTQYVAEVQILLRNDAHKLRKVWRQCDTLCVHLNYFRVRIFSGICHKHTLEAVCRFLKTDA